MNIQREIKEVDDYISKLPENIQLLTETLRSLILETASILKEEYKWSMPNYTYNGLVCYLQASKKHVDFGFHKGNELEDYDRNHLLQGSGNTMRHVRVKQTDDIQADIFRELLRKAIDLNKN